jgi:hypothetical protein
MAIMISKYRHKEISWVILDSPTEEEIAYILEEWDIPSFIREDVTKENKEDIIRLEYGYIFAHLNLPNPPFEKNEKNRLIFIANSNFIIVIHDKPIQALNQFSKEMELDAIIDTEKRLGTNDSRLLFANLLKSLYINSEKQIVTDNARIKFLKKQLHDQNKKFRLLAVLSFLLLGAIILISCL